MTAKLIKHDRLARSQFLTQYVLHRLLAFISGKLEDLQIHFVGNGVSVLSAKLVIGEAKVAAREHLCAITVVGKRGGLSHQ